jgi:putative methyltransferase (TIGR04325 family)
MEPPLEDDLGRYAVGDRVPPPYYFGVHPEGLDKAIFDDPFNTPAWIEHCEHVARRFGIERLRNLGDPESSSWKRLAANAFNYVRSPPIAAQMLASGIVSPIYLLPVAAMIRDTFLRKGKVSVLDVGGGFGANYFGLLRGIHRDALRTLSYEVVDNERSCVLGRRLFSRYAVKPRFTSDHHALQPAYDIVVIVGTLQYIASWREALAGMADRATLHLYVARSPIGATTFSTTQLICPAYGPRAGQNLGATRINVIGLEDLRQAMRRPSWQPTFEFMDADYSARFARLPDPFNRAAHYCMGWSRSAG